MMAFLTIFRRFPTSFRRFATIFQNLSKTGPNVIEHFWKNSEDYRRLLKTFDEESALPRLNKGHLFYYLFIYEDPKMFRSYTNKFKYNLSHKFDKNEVIDIFTSGNMENTPPVPDVVYEWLRTGASGRRVVQPSAQQSAKKTGEVR